MGLSSCDERLWRAPTVYDKSTNGASQDGVKQIDIGKTFSSRSASPCRPTSWDTRDSGGTATFLGNPHIPRLSFCLISASLCKATSFFDQKHFLQQEPLDGAVGNLEVWSPLKSCPCSLEIHNLLGKRRVWPVTQIQKPNASDDFEKWCWYAQNVEISCWCCKQVAERCS